MDDLIKLGESKSLKVLAEFAGGLVFSRDGATIFVSDDVYLVQYNNELIQNYVSPIGNYYYDFSEIEEDRYIAEKPMKNSKALGYMATELLFQYIYNGVKFDLKEYKNKAKEHMLKYSDYANKQRVASAVSFAVRNSIINGYIDKNGNVLNTEDSPYELFCEIYPKGKKYIPLGEKTPYSSRVDIKVEQIELELEHVQEQLDFNIVKQMLSGKLPFYTIKQNTIIKHDKLEKVVITESGTVFYSNGSYYYDDLYFDLDEALRKAGIK